MTPMNNFIITKEYKRFVQFCNACKKEKYIGLCYGDAGVGKSMSAKYFAEWTKIQEDIERLAYSLIGLYPSIDMKLLSTIIYTPDISNTSKSIKDDIKNLMYMFNRLKEKSIYKDEAPFEARQKNYVETLIIDEADRIQPKSLEQLRDIYDRYNIALVLIGMPGIEKRLIRFPQFYSRIGFCHAFKSLSEEEMRFIIQNNYQSLNIDINPNDFSDHEAISAVARITQGNFRLINRLLKQAIRIMEVNQISSISKEVIEAARECLVIGNVY